MKERDGDWCIARTSAGQTVPLMKALIDAGFDAWTPIQPKVKRAGEARKRVDAPEPITARYVFVRYDRLVDLIELARSPSMLYQVWDSEKRCMVTKGIPHFTVFHDLTGYGRVPDWALNPLRTLELRAKPKSEIRKFAAGEAVQHPASGFEGLGGTVVEVRRKTVMVQFPGMPWAVEMDHRWLVENANAA